MEQARACEAFLTHRRLAVVGVSRDPRDFSRVRRRRTEPAAATTSCPSTPGGDGQADPFIRRVPGHRSAGAGRPADDAPCGHDRGREGLRGGGYPPRLDAPGVGRAAASAAAIAFCESHGISVVSGACPLMYLPETGFVHRAHRWCREVLRSPRAAGAATASASGPDRQPARQMRRPRLRRKTLRPR